MRDLILVCIGLLLTVSCANKSSSVGTAMPNEDGFECSFNAERSYKLCLKSSKIGKSESEGIGYMVYDIAGANVVLEGSISQGHVKWLNDDAVEIYEIPGMVSTELSKDDVKRIFVISQNVTMSKSQYIEQQ